MNKSLLLTVYRLASSPIVIRLAWMALAVTLACLGGPATALACSQGSGGSCGG